MKISHEKIMGKTKTSVLTILFVLVMGLALIGCGPENDDSKTSEVAGTADAEKTENDTTKTDKDAEETQILTPEQNQDEEKTDSDKEDSEDGDTSQEDSDGTYQVFTLANPDEGEYFGETSTFMISYSEENIQITLDFIGANTYAVYEPDDTGFSAQPEVISFSMGEDGMGVPSENNSTLELKVNGDTATMIFHYFEGGQSDPVNFELVE